MNGSAELFAAATTWRRVSGNSETDRLLVSLRVISQSNSQTSVGVRTDVIAGIVDRIERVVASVERVRVYDERSIVVEDGRIGGVIFELNAKMVVEVIGVPGGATRV